MNAIRTQQRPSAPIPHWGISDPATVNWVTHITGWVGGAVVAVGLAFFVHSVDNSVRPVVQQGPAPVAGAVGSSGSSVVVPSWQAPASASQATTGQPGIAAATESHADAQTGYRDEPNASEPAAPRQVEQAAIAEPATMRAQPAQVRPQVRIGDDTDMLHVKNNGFTGQQHNSLNAVTHESEVSHATIAPPHENVEATPTPAKSDTASTQVAPPPTSSDSDDVSAQSGMGENVDTGRERIGQDTVRSNP